MVKFLFFFFCNYKEQINRAKQNKKREQMPKIQQNKFYANRTSHISNFGGFQNQGFEAENFRDSYENFSRYAQQKPARNDAHNIRITGVTNSETRDASSSNEDEIDSEEKTSGRKQQTSSRYQTESKISNDHLVAKINTRPLTTQKSNDEEIEELERDSPKKQTKSNKKNQQASHRTIQSRPTNESDDEDVISSVEPQQSLKPQNAPGMTKSKSINSWTTSETPVQQLPTSQSSQALYGNNQQFSDYFDVIATNLSEFVFKPAPQNLNVKCRITRDKHGVDRGNLEKMTYKLALAFSF